LTGFLKYGRFKGTFQRILIGLFFQAFGFLSLLIWVIELDSFREERLESRKSIELLLLYFNLLLNEIGFNLVFLFGFDF